MTTPAPTLSLSLSLTLIGLAFLVYACAANQLLRSLARTAVQRARACNLFSDGWSTLFFSLLAVRMAAEFCSEFIPAMRADMVVLHRMRACIKFA